MEKPKLQRVMSEEELVDMMHFGHLMIIASRPHMVVYCMKFVLRGESPRKKTEPYVDILRSLAFPPSINIFDMPHCIARHANHTVQYFFRPNNGRLFPPTEENITAMK